MKILLINCTHERLSFDHDKGSIAYFKCSIDIIRHFFPNAELISTIQFPNSMVSQFNIKLINSPRYSSRAFSLLRVLNSSLDFLLVVCLRLLRDMFKQDTIISSKNILINKRKKLLAYTKADIIIHLGLDHFSDNGGFITVLEHSKDIMLARLLNKQIILFSQSPGPFDNKVTIWLAKNVLSRAGLIIVREESSLKILSSIGINENVKVTADPAFLLLPACHDRIDIILHNEIGNFDTAKNTVGLVVSGYNTLSLTTKKSRIFNIIECIYSLGLFIVPDILEDRYVKISKKIFDSFKYDKLTSCNIEIVNLIDLLVKDLDVNVLLMSHSHSTGLIDEVKILENYQKMSKYQDKVKIIRGNYSPEDIKGIIGKCDLIISTKMHACIAALSQGVPTIAIARNHKYRGIMHMFKEDNCVCNSINSQEIGSIVKNVWRMRIDTRNKLLEKMTNIKECALLTGKLIADIVNVNKGKM